MIRDEIMIVDDDPGICRLLEIYVSNEGYDTITFQQGSRALDHVENGNPSLVLLDIVMPEMDGFEVLERIRAFSNIPVILITARDLLDDKILGFALGADDYIVKPFAPLEVLARIRARLRKHSRYRGAAVTINNISLDISRNEVKVDNKPVELKRKEIQLLQFMLNHHDIVLTREDLFERVWHDSYSTGKRTVDMHIKRLREKLTDAGAGVSIHTVWGAGYKLVEKQ